MENPAGISGLAAISPRYRQALHWALTLAAAGIPHKMRRWPEGWAIVVPSGLEDTARREIAAYEAENRNWPPPKPVDAPEVRQRFSASSEPPTIAIMGSLLVFHAMTGPWSEKSTWFSQGAVSVSRILEHGEWWRVVTALTLHADPVHVFGNAIIGGALIHFLCRMLGSGLAWFLVLLAGGLGNTINVLFRDRDFLSVGFSTAVFGAIGIFCGLKTRRGMKLRELLPPAGAGLGLLALLGVEGKQTDLGAHLWGLAAGILLGAAAACIPAVYRLSRGGYAQFGLFAISCLGVFLSWWLAFGGR